MPPPLRRKPTLKRFDDSYVEAFFACSHSRQSGFGVQPILVSEVKSYLDLVGIDSREERAKYLRIIQRLDSVYMSDAAEKLKAKNKKP